MKIFPPFVVFLLVSACSTGLATGSFVIQGTAVPPLPTLAAAQVAEGGQLYGVYCAACHGADLAGKTEWKTRQADGSYPAPPNDSTGHTWHHPDELLLEIILDGGDELLGSKMPAFGEQIDEKQGRAILEFIKSYWGKDEREFQWWITAR